MRRAAELTIVLILLVSCAKNPVTGKRDLVLLTEGQEIAMGKESDPEIVSFFGLYKDEGLQKFINEKGQEMAAVSHRKDLKYEFKIVDSPVVNAFAVPGGYVYFTRGIMAHFNNEAEFAGVLGHEIGHITARHSAKQYSQAMLAQIGLVAGTVISPEFAKYADIAQTGVSLLFLKFGRDAESQSDELGVEYSTRIGYDAQEMAGFFTTLDRIGQKSAGGEVPAFLSTHPDPADRERKVAREAVAWKKKVRAEDLKINRDSYLKLIDGIIYGEDPKQGYVENNVFYHPVLKFRFPVPPQWNIENTPQQVQMAARDGSAMVILTLASGRSLDEAANTVLQRYELTLVDSRRAQVNGLPALVMVAEQQQQQQQEPVRTLIYLIEYGGYIYNMIGVSARSNFNVHSSTFESTMNGFRELTEADKLDRQPERIKIRTAQRNGTLAQILKDYNMDQDRMEELAILNGMTLNEKVQKGMLVKTIQR